MVKSAKKRLAKVNPVARAMLRSRRPKMVVQSKKTYNRKKVKHQDNSLGSKTTVY